MPALQQPFNSSQFDPATGFSQLPVGEHPVIIVASSIDGNKNQTGGYVKLSVKAIDGPANGLSMDWRLNLYNASQKAAEIAHRQLSAICHAVGVPAFQQTEELHGKPFVVIVQPQKEDDKYNEISGCKYINGEQIKPGQYGVAGGQAPVQGGAWGGQPQGQQQPQAQQPQGAWGGAQAQGQPQQPPQQQPQQPAQGQPAWGGSPQGQQQPQQQTGGQAWGGAPAANNGAGQWQQGQQQPGNKPAWG
jgi:hypothetical protein